MSHLPVVSLSPHLEGVLRAMAIDEATKVADADKIILTYYGFVTLQIGAGWFITKLGWQYLKSAVYSRMELA